MYSEGFSSHQQAYYSMKFKQLKVRKKDNVDVMRFPLNSKTLHSFLSENKKNCTVIL